MLISIGNYIISGGNETVLVLWQLSTGQKQFLPHLTAAIEQLVVSPSGASYGVHLADNSIMVLSTTEFKPKTNIAGIQSRLIDLKAPPDVPILRTATTEQEDRSPMMQAISKTPAAIRATNPNQLLLSVPSSQSKKDRTDVKHSAPYLQCYDISSSHHVSRQALTRNNATDFNKGPNQVRIQEADIGHMSVSADGKWLATIEEWTPPIADVDYLSVDDDQRRDERRIRREIYLKFWLLERRKEVWMLETRIDAPHRSADGLISGHILDLVADPTSTGFATIGEDQTVRVWSPKSRLRDGTIVRGTMGEEFVTWSCQRTIHLKRNAEYFETLNMAAPVVGLLAYSDDGSILAAAQQFQNGYDEGEVFFINTSSGAIQDTRAGLYEQGLSALGFIDRYLIIVAETLTVWDLVDDALNFTFAAPPPTLTRSQSSKHTSRDKPGRQDLRLCRYH